MIATLLSLVWPITVLLIVGVVVFAVAWWATLALEEHDDILWEADDDR